MPYTTLVSTEVLAASLHGGWAIVDCRYDLQNEAWGLEQYRAGHIPGAVHASLSHDLAGERTGTNGRHPVPSPEALAAVFGRLGISNAQQVVVYDQDAGMYASRLWWSLRYLGHDAVAVLDGGWARWTREQRPVATGDEPPHAATFIPSARPGMLAGIADVEQRDRAATLLLDARAPERFEGRQETVDRAAGHIPGAANRFFKANLSADGTMRPAAELHAAFTALLGGRDVGQAIMYCGSGVTACHNLLALEHAGLPGARLYPGSWSEWSSDPARPIEIGPATSGS